MNPFLPDKKKIVDLLNQRPQPVVTVVGDFCLDKYLYIDARLDEPSVETGLTAYQVRRKALYAGVGGTISNNLAALGAKIFCVGIYGNDGEGFELIRELKKIGADCSGMVGSDAIFTSTYTKPMRKTDGVWTELHRLDIRNSVPAPAEMVEQIKRNLDERIPQSDAVIISDQFTYQAGSVLCDDLRQYLAQGAEKNSNIFFLADSRSFSEQYRGVIVKCNSSEILDSVRRMTESDHAARVAADSTADEKIAQILEAGTTLFERNRRPILVTRGASGSLLFDDSGVTAIPAFRATPPLDICGAGDATDAALAFGRAIGLDLANAAFFAAAVSSITIEQLGVTGTATIEQAIERIETFHP